MKKATIILPLILSLFVSGQSLAQSVSAATLLGAGNYEREEAGGSCTVDLAFIAGQYGATSQLMVGGDSSACDSEWGAFAEFDFSGPAEAGTIVSAILLLRYTGYSDDFYGFPYIGVFDYPYANGPVSLLRADLNEQTALDLIVPTGTTNVDFEIDVTDQVIGLADDVIFQAGFFWSGIFSEVGYDTLVSFAGSSHQYAPRLIITTTGPVQNECCGWDSVKSLFR